MFAKVFFGIIDPANGAMLYINGGHDAPMIAAADGPRATLVPTGPALGLLPASQFNIAFAELAPGELLLAYTDGATDARRLQKRENWGEEERGTLLGTEGTARQVRDRVTMALAAHTAGGQAFYDVTLRAVRRTL